MELLVTEIQSLNNMKKLQNKALFANERNIHTGTFFAGVG